MPTIEDTFIQSPLVEIFWTTYIPFVIAVLCVIGGPALRSLSKRLSESDANWDLSEQSRPTRCETGDHAIRNFRSEPLSKRDWRLSAEPHFGLPEQTLPFRNAYAWKARLSASQLAQGGDRRPIAIR
jgi:hypothetical protein